MNCVGSHTLGMSACVGGILLNKSFACLLSKR
jgi:hypothetical protein